MDSVCSNRGFTLALLAMFACADALMLASCGGGGGAAPPAPPLAFALPGPLQKTYGDSPFTDLATGGAGTGAITYSTSNASVGRVGATTGTVTITGAGQATFTVDAIPKTIQLHGWIGISDTVVSAVPAVPTVGLFRSASASCDLSQYSSCPQGQFNVFGSSTIADSAATLSRPAYYWLQHGPYISNPALITPTKFSPRAQAQLIAFNGRLWVIGGYDGQLRKDVWSWADGSTWKHVLAIAPFSAL